MPSHLYSFSFAPNPEWTRDLLAPARDPRLPAPLRRRVRHPPARPPEQRRSTGADVGRGRAALDDRDLDGRAARPRRWSPAWARSPSRRSPTSPGSTTSRARPSTPPAGTTTTTCSGKRVAAIGTGASAIQFVPADPAARSSSCTSSSAPRRGSCRTPNRDDHAASSAPLQALPGAAEARPRRRLRGPRAVRARLRQAPEAHEGRREDRPRAHAQADLATRSCSRRSRRTTRSAASASCRRTAGIRRSASRNVELLTGGVEEIRATRSSPATASEREVDAIIFGTGFQVTDMPVGELVRGRDGQTLDDVWQGSPQAHLGTAIAGLPEPVPAARAEHRPRAHARWST